MNFIRTIAIIKIALLVLIPSTAASQAQEAHVHGTATLMLAAENGVLEIYLESPAANLVGFEHEATSEKEIQSVKRAESILDAPQSLFAINGSTCELSDIELELGSLIAHEEHDDHAHHDHHHKHKHKHEHEHEHHTEHDEAHDAHSEITALYQFKCRDLDRLKSIDVKLFTNFPGLEKLNVMWVTDSSQSAAILTPNNSRLQVK